MKKPLCPIDVGEKDFVGLLAEGSVARFFGNGHVLPRLSLQPFYALASGFRAMENIVGQHSSRSLVAIGGLRKAAADPSLR